MEALELKILEKGLSSEVINEMQKLEYELLKLDKATFEQGEDKLRKRELNKTPLNNRIIKQLRLQKSFYEQLEILNRESLPLQELYQEKVNSYFKEM